MGKVGNSQIGGSVHAVCDHASAAVDWRLFIPEAWDDACTGAPILAQEIRRRRARCGIDDEERNRPKWQLAIEMLDELGDWGLSAPVICADAGYGDNAQPPIRIGGLAAYEFGHLGVGEDQELLRLEPGDDRVGDLRRLEALARRGDRPGRQVAVQVSGEQRGTHTLWTKSAHSDAL